MGVCTVEVLLGPGIARAAVPESADAADDEVIGAEVADRLTSDAHRTASSRSSVETDLRNAGRGHPFDFSIGRDRSIAGRSPVAHGGWSAVSRRP